MTRRISLANVLRLSCAEENHPIINAIKKYRVTSMDSYQIPIRIEALPLEKTIFVVKS
jgi:hypothetical protein